MLVCFTLGGASQRFFGMHYRVLPRINIHIINCDHTYVTFAPISMQYRFQLVTRPSHIYVFKVDNENTRTRCEICSKLTIKTLERRQWRRCGVFIFNFEHISNLLLVFLLLTLNK